MFVAAGAKEQILKRRKEAFYNDFIKKLLYSFVKNFLFKAAKRTVTHCYSPFFFPL